MKGIALLDDWVEGVDSGRYVASRNNILAVRRHLKDIGQAGRYTFDRSQADKAIRIAQSFFITKPRAQLVDLHPFQAFVFGSLFGWVHSDRPAKRRFVKALVFTARKSGKSWLAAAIALVYWLLEEQQGNQAEIFALANKKQQAEEIHQAVRGIVQNTRGLDAFFNLKYKGKIISRKFDSSYLQPVAYSDKGLNDGSYPSCVLVDEFHASETDRHVEELIRGMISRENPLEVYTSTAGLLTSGYPLYEMCQHAERVLTGESIDETFFSVLFQLDSIDEVHKPDAWVKANPRLTDDMREWLENQLATAQGTGAGLDGIIVKNMNMFSASSTRIVSEDVWKDCRMAYDLVEDTGWDAYVGIDIGRKDDTCAFVAVAFDPSDDTMRIYYHCIVPLGTYEALRKTHANITSLMASPCVTVAQGETISDEEILQGWEAFTARLNVVAVGYDRMGIDSVLADMREVVDLGEKDFLAISQGHAAQGTAIRNIRQYCAQRKLVHAGDRFFDWQLANATMKTNTAHINFVEKPAPGSYRKIDLVDALFSAITMRLTEI